MAPSVHSDLSLYQTGLMTRPGSAPVEKPTALFRCPGAHLPWKEPGESRIRAKCSLRTFHQACAKEGPLLRTVPPWQMLGDTCHT